jgi:hypothetical protein
MGAFKILLPTLSAIQKTAYHFGHCKYPGLISIARTMSAEKKQYQSPWVFYHCPKPSCSPIHSVGGNTRFFSLHVSPYRSLFLVSPPPLLPLPPPPFPLHTLPFSYQPFFLSLSFSLSPLTPLFFHLSPVPSFSLKVDGNEKLGGGRKETVIQLLSGIVAIGAYFKF